MARRKRKSKSNALNWAIVWTLVVITLFCLAITFSSRLGIPGVPTWQELGAMFNPQQKQSDGSDPVTVKFFDVGQGDCTLITANGRHILIDAGENDQADRVVRYLRDEGVKKIDVLIGTHPHSDHIGGMDAVVESFDIGQVILPKLTEEQTPTTKTYLDLLTAIADKGLKVTRAKSGDVIELGGGRLELLGPVSEYSDLNNMSVTARFVYDEISFWIAGDCSKEAEADLLSKKLVTRTNVYKVSHHGSNTASTEAFLNALSPDACVISLGAGNSYGHPHKEVTRLFKKLGLTVYRTDLNGTVTAHTDGKTLTFTTEK